MKSIILAVLVLAGNAAAQTVDRSQVQKANLCFEAAPYDNHCEEFVLPVIVKDTGDVKKLAESPVDRARLLDSLPNFGIASWHHWLFSQILFRAQRQLADCVGEIRGYQKLLGESPLIDEEPNPSAGIIKSLREYEVPFAPIQNTDDNNGGTDTTRAPRLEDVKLHLAAALASINGTVEGRDLCRGVAEGYRVRVRALVEKPAVVVYLPAKRKGR